MLGDSVRSLIAVTSNALRVFRQCAVRTLARNGRALRHRFDSSHLRDLAGPLLDRHQAVDVPGKPDCAEDMADDR